MLPDLCSDMTEERAPPPSGGDAPVNRSGLVISLALHGLAAFLLIFHMNAPAPRIPVPFLPVELVRLAEQTTSPPVVEKPAAPQQLRTASLQPKPPQTSAARPPIPNAPGPAAEAPVAPPQPDALDTQLEALSKLRQVPTDPRLLNDSGASDTIAGNGARGGQAGYSVKDYIRAQVERRWNLDMGTLGERNFTIAIHVVLAADGTVTAAEIVDQKRYVSDATYRFIAVSARNAVLLSSPFALPSDHEGVMEVTLDLNPRDTMR